MKILKQILGWIIILIITITIFMGYYHIIYQNDTIGELFIMSLFTIGSIIGIAGLFFIAILLIDDKI